jgi:hypothetical protein
MGRRSDTEAIARRPLEGSLTHTTTTEKIGTGYVTTETTYNSHTGEHREKKTLSGIPPRRDPAREEGLKDTMQYLNNDRIG